MRFEVGADHSIIPITRVVLCARLLTHCCFHWQIFSPGLYQGPIWSSRCSPHSSAGEGLGPELQTERMERDHKFTLKTQGNDVGTVGSIDSCDNVSLQYCRFYVLTLNKALKISSSSFSSWVKTEAFRWTIAVKKSEERNVSIKMYPLFTMSLNLTKVSLICSYSVLMVDLESGLWL